MRELERRGGVEYWHQNTGGRSGGGTPGRPVVSQVAVALYILGASGGTFDRIRMKLNIGKGTVLVYL